MTNEHLDELIQKYVLGNLTESEATELSGHLERDDAGDSRRKLRLALRADAYLQEAAADMNESVRKNRLIILERVLWPLGSIVAAIVIGIFTWSQGPDSRQEVNDQTVATIRRIEGEARNTSGDSLLNGTRLIVGEEVTIDSGLVEIVFQDTGVHAIATAPMSMTLHSSDRVFLHSGNLKLHVPPQGIGFVVETAEREITDLGTSFVVTAGKGKSRVLVLDGLVAIDRKPGDGEQYLSEGEAATFTQKGDLKLLIEKVRTMPEIALPTDSSAQNSLSGEIYTLKPSELPGKREPVDLLGQRFLPLIDSGFQDRSNLAGLRKRTSALPFPAIAGAYSQFAKDQGIGPVFIGRSGWVAWHKGKLTPPQPGRYRFWGYADNTLLVAINGRAVFEGGRKDSALRESRKFPRRNHPEWPCLNSEAGFASGEWFEAGDEPVQFDLLFGEKRGLLTYGLLLIEREGDVYDETYYGQPRWPLFLTETPLPGYREQLDQLHTYLEEKLLGSFSISEDAVWKVDP